MIWGVGRGCGCLYAGCWLLAAGCWLLATGYWLLAAGACRRVACRGLLCAHSGGARSSLSCPNADAAFVPWSGLGWWEAVHLLRRRDAVKPDIHIRQRMAVSGAAILERTVRVSGPLLPPAMQSHSAQPRCLTGLTSATSAPLHIRRSATRLSSRGWDLHYGRGMVTKS